MKKYFAIFTNAVAATLFFCSLAFAQTSGTQSAPAQGGQSSTASKASAAKPAQSSPAKSTTGTGARTGTQPPLTTDQQKGSYAVGLNIGNSIKEQPVAIDIPSLLRGIKDGAGGTTPALTEAELDAALKFMQAQAKEKQEAALQKEGDANLKEGEAFLAANKTKDGVMTTASGLQYKIIATGSGPKPTKDDTVVCNYRGTLINGNEFDSSYKRGKPAEFPVGGVIPGWTEALQMMPVGSKWQLFIPPNLAYGPRGAGGVIGPNQTLIFEVELMSIKGK
jgi:FKBP-type peptidyl-prolyl cis-trans isomerase FklB